MNVKHALLVAGIVGCAGDPPLSPRDPTPGSVHFLVMTYNINQPNVSNETLEAIGTPKADIVCLQETNDEWRHLIETRYAADYPNMIFATNDTTGGLAVLSRYPLVDRGLIALPGDSAQWHPGAVVEVDTPGGPIQVVNVHLRAMFEGNSNPISNWASHGSDHVQEMNTFLEHTTGAMPIVLAGDFNEGPTGASVRALENRGFVNVLPAFRPGQYTWRANSVGGEADLTEDYVMFDRGFEPLNAWVVRIGASDHLPVIAHVQLLQTTKPFAPRYAAASKLKGSGAPEHLAPLEVRQLAPAHAVFGAEHQALVHANAQP